MKRMDLIEVAAKLLEANGHPVIIERFDRLVGKEGNCIQRLPSTIVARKMDGGRTLHVTYRVCCRYRSAERAMDECEAIAEVLDDAYLPSKTGAYTFISNEVYTWPAEMALDEANFYCWQVRLTAEIEI